MDFLNLPTIFAAPRKVFLDCCWEARIGAPIYRIRGRHHHVCTAGILVSVQARIRVRRLAALSKHLLIPSTCNGPYLGKLGNIPFDSLSPIDHVEPAWCCWNSQRTQTVASRVDVSGKLGWQEKSNSCFREKKTIPAWIDAFENFIESLLGTQHRYGHRYGFDAHMMHILKTTNTTIHERCVKVHRTSRSPTRLLAFTAECLFALEKNASNWQSRDEQKITARVYICDLPDDWCVRSSIRKCIVYRSGTIIWNVSLIKL